VNREYITGWWINRPIQRALLSVYSGSKQQCFLFIFTVLLSRSFAPRQCCAFAFVFAVQWYFRLDFSDRYFIHDLLV
jgi:hypothetical protein